MTRTRTQRRRSAAQRGCSKADEAGAGGSESATAEIERAEVVFEVDVQPLASGAAGLRCGEGDKGSPDTLPLRSGGDERVENERVAGAVPGDVDEAEQGPHDPCAELDHARRSNIRD